MVGRYIVRWEAFNNLSKEDRRKIKVKIAQRKFRDRANPKSEQYDGRRGGKMVYVPKGWNSTVSPPIEPVERLAQAGRLAKNMYAKAKAKVAPKPTEAQVP